MFRSHLGLPLLAGIPPDLVALSVPIAFAASMFGFMASPSPLCNRHGFSYQTLKVLYLTLQVFRAFVYDPEWTNGITPETAEWNKKGDVYRNQIGGFFRAGPGRHTSIFNNEVIIKEAK